MIEIKFRAYNKNTKKVEEVKEISFFKGDFVLITRCIETLKMQEQINSSEAELLQFTGLKDKNDIEIYEGDCVRFQVQDGGYVVYIKGSFQFKAIKGFCLPDIRQECEVIGNIYENPELIVN